MTSLASRLICALCFIVISSDAEAWTQSRCRPFTLRKEARLFNALDELESAPLSGLRHIEASVRKYCEPEILAELRIYFATKMLDETNLTWLWDLAFNFSSANEDYQTAVRSKIQSALSAAALERLTDELAAGQSFAALGTRMESNCDARRQVNASLLVLAALGLEAEELRTNAPTVLNDLYMDLKALVIAHPADLRFDRATPQDLAYPATVKPWSGMIRTLIGKAMLRLKAPDYATFAADLGVVGDYRTILLNHGILLSDGNVLTGDQRAAVEEAMSEVPLPPTSRLDTVTVRSALVGDCVKIGEQPLIATGGILPGSAECNLLEPPKDTSRPNQSSAINAADAYSAWVYQVSSGFEILGADDADQASDRTNCYAPGSIGGGVNIHASPLTDLELTSEFGARPVKAPQFCDVLEHEFAHAIDFMRSSLDDDYSRRKALLLERAGTDAREYLRSLSSCGGRDAPVGALVGARCDYFLEHAQEFVASIANQFLADSASSFAFAANRYIRGFHEPLNQFLFFLDLYSAGSGSGRFYWQGTDCLNISGNAGIHRNANGRIDGFSLAGARYDFQVDDDGFVTGIDGDTQSLGAIPALSPMPVGIEALLLSADVMDHSRFSRVRIDGRFDLGQTGLMVNLFGNTGWELQVEAFGSDDPLDTSIPAPSVIWVDQDYLDCDSFDSAGHCWGQAGWMSLSSQLPDSTERQVVVDRILPASGSTNPMPGTGGALRLTARQQESGGTLYTFGIQSGIYPLQRWGSDGYDRLFTDPEDVLGDIDGNGEFNGRDEVALTDVLSAGGAYQTLPVRRLAAADVDGNSRIDDGDLRVMKDRLGFYGPPHFDSFPQRYGDVDGDGIVGEGDLSLLYCYLTCVSDIPQLTLAQKIRADVNFDGTGSAPIVNYYDYQIIRDHVRTGQPASLP